MSETDVYVGDGGEAPSRKWKVGLLAWTVALGVAAFTGALVGVLYLGLGPCDASTSFGTARDRLCDSRYDLLAFVPPATVVAGALAAWRTRSYRWLVVGSVLAALAVGLLWSLPELFPG